MTSNTKSYLLDYEIEGEAERIDWQHQLDVQTCGLFPRWINTKELGAIADVATGTGIWLQDVARSLSKPGHATTDRQYHGFDITAKPFTPQSDNAATTFAHTVHNLMDPFPSAFQGKFDLVHVRYATSFIKPDQVATALKNISELVKPGGHLVWTETHVSRFTLTNPENERHKEIWQIAVDFVTKTGSANLPDELLQAAREEQGLEVCEELTVHVSNVVPLEQVQQWELNSMKALLPPVVPMLRPELDAEAIQKEVKRAMDDLKEILQKGESWKPVNTTLTFHRT